MAVSDERRNKYIEDRQRNRYTESELRAIAREIVRKSKAEAHVDTGLLKRSIRYVINLNGIFTFTEMFYGQFHDNSSLQENIDLLWPDSEPYLIIYQDDKGGPAQVVRKSASGRATVSNATQRTTRKSLGINGIKNFLNKIKDGKKKDEGTDSSGQDN